MRKAWFSILAFFCVVLNDVIPFSAGAFAAVAPVEFKIMISWSGVDSDGRTGSEPVLPSESTPKPVLESQVDALQAQEKESVVIELGKALERELSGGQTHSYPLTLSAGQFLSIAAEQRGIDIALRLVGPDGKPLAAVDANNSNQGAEAVRQLIEVSGAFRLEVLSRQKEAPAGRYEVRIVELRAATEKDRAMLAALAEALRLTAPSGEFNRLNSAGKYDEALAVAEKALALREQYLPADDPLIALSLTTLGGICLTKGDYLRAEEALDRAVVMNEKLRGANHPDLASVARLLGLTCRRKGDYKKAERQFQRSLAIREKVFKADHPSIAQSLDDLASLYADQIEYPQSLELYKRALAIREKTLKPEDPVLLRSRNNLASIYQEMGDIELAEPIYRQVLAFHEKGGAESPNAATTLNNLAVLTLLKGEYEKAEPMYRRALEIREKTLGGRHPLVAQSLDAFAVLYELKGEIAKAVELRTRALEIRERHLGLILASGSEEQKRAYLAQISLSDETNITISLHARSAPRNPQAASMALSFILQRKGRLLDAMSDNFGALRRRLDPQDRVLLEQYAAVNSRLANLILSGQSNPQTQAEIARLEAERQQLESSISAKVPRSQEFGLQSQPATLDRVQKLIPAGAALVEIAAYQPFDPREKKALARYGPPRYVAYVLKPQGPPAFVELGAAAAIDRRVNALREALRDPKRRDVKRVARRADARVMRPIRALLGSTRKVLLSPDGALNLLPFAALVDERGRYLASRYSFSYLTSGRDLLRLETRQTSRQGPLVVADPDFGEAADGSSAQRLLGQKQGKVKSAGALTIDLSKAVFTPLKGTEGEARSLKSLLPDATVLTREQATEATVKQVEGPRLLHIATHGFFLDERFAGESVNPLLRSGLGLAGANRRKSGNEDGILTALEMSSLNLQGTKLVVLSACDTGVGEVRAGDGVYGLRRALVLAGSETQVMSLWPVSDRATRDLMIEYYKRLQRGEGRGEALRRVQLMMLRRGAVGEGGGSRLLLEEQNDKPAPKPASTRMRKDFSHPYYWAGFIPSGEWGNLDGKR